MAITGTKMLASDAYREKQTAILKVAGRVLSQDGYASFSMRKIAADSGLSLRTIQHYFPTKRVLLSATVDYVVGTFRNYRPKLERIAKKHGGQRVLSECIKIFITVSIVAEQGEFSLECWSVARKEPAVRETLMGLQKSGMEYAAWILLQCNPELSEKEAEIRGTIVFSTMSGLVPLLLCDSLKANKLPRVRRELETYFLALAKL